MTTFIFYNLGLARIIFVIIGNRVDIMSVLSANCEALLIRYIVVDIPFHLDIYLRCRVHTEKH